MITDVVGPDEPGPIAANSSIEAPADQVSTVIMGADPADLPNLENYQTNKLTDYIESLVSPSFPGETWNITSVSGAATLTDGVVSYNAGASGQDSFTYEADNTGGASNIATVTITVPPAVPDCSTVDQDVASNSAGTSITLSCTAPAGVPVPRRSTSRSRSATSSTAPSAVSRWTELPIIICEADRFCNVHHSRFLVSVFHL